MNIYQDIPSPAQAIAAQNASIYGLHPEDHPMLAE